MLPTTQDKSDEAVDPAEPGGRRARAVCSVRIRRLDASVELPRYGTDGSAAFDLAAAEDAVIAPGEVRLVPTGLVIEVPEGMFLGSLRAQQHAAQARTDGRQRCRRRRLRLLRSLATR